MTTPTAHSPRRLFSAVLLLLLLAGCRTYGGHGSEEATMAELLDATELFADELARARADYTLLQEAAATALPLREVAAQYATVLELHETVIAYNRATLAELEDGGSYRRLNRALGAMTAEHEKVRDMYLTLWQDVYSTRAGVEAVRLASPDSRYMIAPPFYERILIANNRSRIMQSLRGADPAADTTDADAGGVQ